MKTILKITKSKWIRGWSGGATVLENFQCWGVLLILIIVGQGPIVLAVGAGGVVFTFSLSLSGGRANMD